MGTSKEDTFRKAVHNLNLHFEEKIEERLRGNKSASLREMASGYLQSLYELEKESGFSADVATETPLGMSPYRFTPQSVTKVVHFIRHGHGFHNQPILRNELDPRLTNTGWKQVFELREHIHQLSTPFEIELVVTSPLTRCLETTAGIFGCEKKIDDGALLKRPLGEGSNREGMSSCALYKPRGLPIVAQELCRECLLGNQCDLRREKSELVVEFPGIDFTRVEYEMDLLGESVRKEWGDRAGKRAQSFVKWLMNRPQTHIAVVSHCSFLSFVMKECTRHLKGQMTVAVAYVKGGHPPGVAKCRLPPRSRTRVGYRGTPMRIFAAPEDLDEEETVVRVVPPPDGITQPSRTPDIPPGRFGFVEYAERLNSRAAMIGFFGILILEFLLRKGILQLAGFNVGSGLGFEF